jgi:2-keto-4-pentenoate hydratase/2-oxohepta-3-ene-1,7-dioic acid hydratase in catechol pathway
MLPGQVVSVDIEGIGTLTNPVVSAAADQAPNEAEQ